MRSWVVDTNVVSELSRLKPDPKVLAFLDRSPSLALSVITLHELEYGIQIAAAQRRDKLRRWLVDLEVAFEGRIIDVTLPIGRAAAELRAAETRSGRVLSALDSLIAATALTLGAGLATRNTVDFEELPLVLIDPWKAPS
jgi:toxin FitB